MDDSAGLDDRIEKLNTIGIALSAEKDTARLLERILVEAKNITGADGGTLYLVSEDQQLQFEIIHTDSLNINMGGRHGEPISLSPIPLYTEDGHANESLVVSYCVHHRESVNIEDVYQVFGFDFSGPRAFDEKMGYRTMSALTIPMQNHDNDVIGVLQLINKEDDWTQEIIPFSSQDQQLAESLASQAAVALTNKRLLDDLKTLFEAFIKLIASAIDEKSPYTGKHCRRVPVLTMMLAEAAHKAEQGALKHFALTDEDRYALEVASWLHDCGKVTTPEYIVDKATKLETIYDRIGLIDTRFEVLKRDAEIRKLRQMVKLHELGKINEGVVHQLEERYLNELGQIEEEREFIRDVNIGAEFMSDADKQRVQQIAARNWRDPDNDVMPFLSREEVYNLCINRGTLNAEERDMINHHITMSIDMLNALPFPKHLKQVPEFAGGHHERMDGKGYPKGLKREQLSVPARTMAIADIFEALTAKDRPYKEPKKLSEALQILGRMKQEQHIDPDLFDVFIEQGIYLDYAREFLMPFQIDIEHPQQIPGYPFKIVLDKAG